MPFEKLMQIKKIMHPRIAGSTLAKRRELYRAQDWAQYDRIVIDEISSGTRMSANGHKALDAVLGISYRQMQLSMMSYSLDLSKRDVIERFMSEVVAPTKDKREAKILTK